MFHLASPQPKMFSRLSCQKCLKTSKELSSIIGSFDGFVKVTGVDAYAKLAIWFYNCDH